MDTGPNPAEFKCLSTSLTDVASYSIELRATLADAASTDSTGSTFVYNIVHPCTLTELNQNLPTPPPNQEITIADMQNTVKAGAVTQTGIQYLDKMTLKHAAAHSLDCGLVSYTLAGEWTSTGVTPWLSFDSSTFVLSVQTNDNSH